MSKKINERHIRFKGSTPIAKDLDAIWEQDTQEDIKVAVVCNIAERNGKDNQDGTEDIVYVCKLIGAEVV